ncbi:M64 family metallopeptidase [Mesoterricola silvestris]|uniref:IgA peptidase M64 n=1 Tax=Mesoterricola silvestris TaxID=2927979 RepID=A0AA48K870_9BACT|nr:M64 family metallopeptidase [Mesoterricola silvestris]BDU71946.1 hypothetical protein METEAL_11200 [Mesoterricola silvestris]
MTWILKASLVALLLLAGCAGPGREDPAANLPASALASQVEDLQRSGDPANRIHVVLLGDGYRAEDQAKLSRDARNWLATFVGTPPFANYASYFNVKVVHVVSPQDGASNGSHGLGVTRDTVLGATFRNASPEGVAPDYRLLVVDNARVLALAMALAPECTVALVLVNDSKYGGSGGAVPVFSANPASGLIALHELGHAFGGLADEYQCGDTSALPATLEAFPNVTARRDPDQIKWRSWIAPGVPLPTPAGVPGLGLFEGAYFHDTGVFRPRQACRMRSLGDGFCEVCSEAIVRRIYDRVRPLDPPITPLAANPLRLSVARPVPVPDTVRVAWAVDGAAVAGDGDTLVLPAPLQGNHTVTATVTDTTPLVREGLERLTAVQTWTFGSPQAARVEPARHLVLRLVRTPRGFQVAERRVVDLPLPPDAGRGAWQAEVVGPGGDVQFRTGLEDPSPLRGEFQHPGESGRIQGRWMEDGRPVSFLVRIPWVEDGELALFRKVEGAPRVRLGTVPLGEGVRPAY